MDSDDVRDNKGLRRIKISVGLAALAVIVLILLLALTVRHAREKEMARQFGLQQAAIARETAARLEDLIISVERALFTLAAHPDRFRGEIQKLRAAQTDMEGKVSFMVLTDEAGAVLIKYPPSVIGRYGGFGDVLFFRQARKTGKLAVSIILLPGDQGVNTRSIAIGVPRFRADGKFAGVALAVLPLNAFIDDTAPSAGENWRTWLVDAEGTVLFHPNDAAVGSDVAALEARSGAEPSALRGALLEGTEGYGVYPLRGEHGRPELNIVAHAPIRLESGTWAVAVVTPYNAAIALFRKAFLNIMFAAAGLILAVILAAWVIIYAGGRMIHSRAVEDRLREREEWQEKLLREKRTVEGIIEGSPIPTFVLNRGHRIILWNKACTELTGFTAEEMIGTENQFIPFYSEKRPVIADLILEKDFESIEKYYGTKKVRKSSTVEGAYEARDFYRNLGGKNRHLYFLAAPIYDEKGGVIAAIETIQDTSTEEAMAQELRESAETLRGKLQENIHLREEVESLYNHLQSIIDSLPERLFVLDGDGTIHYMSRGAKEGNGIPQLLRGGHFLELVAPGQRQYVMARWEEAKRGVSIPYELEVKAKDGSDRTLLISGAAIRGTDRYVVVQQDITELKRLEERISENQKMAALGQLSAGIAHEVRNPLSSIKMSLQILEKRMHPAGNDLKRFQIAQREVEHLEKLVNDVLIFAKPAPLRRDSTDLRNVVEQALALAEKGIADKRIRVQTRFDEVPVLKLDAAMLEQAFLNLILNAVDAMGEGGLLKVAVRRSSQEVPGVEVELEDNGCGIDDDDRQHLFNPFFTRKKSGTGLGLAQVKTIVEMHQGQVELFSRKGEGTRVCIRFPAPSGPQPPHERTAVKEAS